MIVVGGLRAGRLREMVEESLLKAAANLPDQGEVEIDYYCGRSRQDLSSKLFRERAEELGLECRVSPVFDPDLLIIKIRRKKADGS